MNALSWYVLRRKPHQENVVQSQLRACGIQIFYPTQAAKPANPRAAEIHHYATTYLSVHLDPQKFSSLKWVLGTIGFVQFDGCVPVVQEALIAEIKRRVEAVQQFASWL